MTDYHLGELLGGPGHTQQAPYFWEDIGEWTRPDLSERVFYQRREYLVGADRYYVWVHAPLKEPLAYDIISWFQAVYRREQIAAQKELLASTNDFSKSYTAAIMAGGFAALFALLTQLKDQLTPATLFAAAGLLALSVALFVGWEIFGMFVRGYTGFAIARAVKDPAEFERKMAAHRSHIVAWAEKSQVAWYVISGSSALAGVLSFSILISAMFHGFILQMVSCTS